MSERAIMAENGEACPQCLAVYPAPTDHAASVTCGACGFVNHFAPEQEIRDDVNADATPFHALGKPRHSRFITAEQNAEAMREMRAADKRVSSQTPVWMWVQPLDRAALLRRLADARDLDVPSRERENLCAVAHGDISRLAEALQGLVENSYSWIDVDQRIGGAPSASVLHVERCHHCEATKGDIRHDHTDDCPVGVAERVLGCPGRDTGRT